MMIGTDYKILYIKIHALAEYLTGENSHFYR